MVDTVQTVVIVPVLPNVDIRCSTLPTELVITPRALHMITPLHLLDPHSAVRTRLCDLLDRPVAHHVLVPSPGRRIRAKLVRLARLVDVPSAAVDDTLPEQAAVAVHCWVAGSLDLARVAFWVDAPVEVFVGAEAGAG